MAKVKYVCTECGGSNLRWDAYAAWSEELQEMELVTTFDAVVCEDCEQECGINEIEIEPGNGGRVK